MFFLRSFDLFFQSFEDEGFMEKMPHVLQPYIRLGCPENAQIGNNRELVQSAPISHPQNQRGKYNHNSLGKAYTVNRRNFPKRCSVSYFCRKQL